MRLISCSLITFGLLAVTPAGAQLSKDYPHPESSDTENWNAFCSGMEREIQRQATEGNNQLAFNEAERRLDNLRQQMTAEFNVQKWTGTNGLTWLAQGEKEAGKPLWDFGQLVNGDNQLRATIRMIRQNDLLNCEQFSDTLPPAH